MIKMLKSATSIMRPIYSHRKQIKTYYETQFLTDPILNNEIRKKNSIKNKIQISIISES
jgi:hypothetical protein